MSKGGGESVELPSKDDGDDPMILEETQEEGVKKKEPSSSSHTPSSTQPQSTSPATAEAAAAYPAEATFTSAAASDNAVLVKQGLSLSSSSTSAFAPASSSSSSNNMLGNAVHVVSSAVSSTLARNTNRTRNSNNNNRSVTSSASSATKKKKPDSNKGEETLLRLLEQARYEVRVDPYRGMMRHHAAAGTATTTSQSLSSSNGSPWRSSCQVPPNSNSSTKKSTSSNKQLQQHQPDVDSSPANTNKTDANNDLPDADAENDPTCVSLVERVTKTTCPCLTQWTGDAKNQKLRQESAFTNVSFRDCDIGLRLQQQQQLKKVAPAVSSASDAGAGAAGSTTTTTTGTAADHNNNNNLVESASAAGAGAAGSTTTAPTGSTADHNNNHNNTNNNLNNQSACSCDYNPYCLLTCGGLMNDVLRDEYLVECGDDINEPPRATDYTDPIAVQSLLQKITGENGLVFRKEELDYTASSSSSSRATTTTIRRATSSSSSSSVAAATVPNTLCVYQPETRTRLSSIRKSFQVPERDVRNHLHRTLHDLPSVEDAIQVLKRRHLSLTFDNPLKEEIQEQQLQQQQSQQHQTTMLRLAVPPGIGNLGSTCYLSTQLQCLAQCLAFLEGIFSWRPSISNSNNNNDRMQSVLQFFQELLALMHAGHVCTVSAVEFSNALGLDHFEQQDPNEFSRLFFERMGESSPATTTAAAAEGGDNNGNTDNNSHLSDLISHLFQGKMCYETTCLACGSRSKRYEDFKDLNLPIVPTSSLSDTTTTKTKKSGQQTLSSSSSEQQKQQQDTTVQTCLDSYTQPEELSGENQYFCSECQTKCNATRQVSFSKLPPVLNIQLCRYVFERKTSTKKKLSDRVLLPLELSVDCQQPPQQQNQSTSTTATTKPELYLLCAVMRHKGTSAYSGHYVAEAMDWTTGQWFEFNDENVTNLEAGPSCSYNPSSTSTSNNNNSDKKENGGSSDSTANPSATKANNTRSRTKPSASNTTILGSKEAYNMFYVEKTFLAKSVIVNLKPDLNAASAASASAESSIASASSSNHHHSNVLSPMDGVIDRVTAERVDAYADLTSMCMRDGKQSRNRSMQRIYLRSEVIPKLSSLEFAPADDVVWVHGETLRRYLDLDFSDLIIPRATLLCTHDTPGLHPRIARRGKLLPRRVFEAFVARNLTWYNTDSFSEADRRALEEQDRQGIVITPSLNMECRVCRDEYCIQLEAKLRKLELLKKLYDLLDPKAHPEISVEMKAHEILASENERFVYIISKGFVTRFRRRFVSLVKTLAAADTMCPLADTSGVTDGMECIAEGIDALPMSSLSFHDKSPTYLLGGSVKDEDEIDPTVNGSITCPHQRLLCDSKRLYRYVPHEAWNIVDSLFPDAIMIRRSRTMKGERVSAIDTANEVCVECEAAKVSKDIKPSPSLAARSGTSTAIVVKSDIKEISDTFSLRVFEVSPGLDENELRSNLSQCAGLPAEENNSGSNGSDQRLRRSRRKRKTSYPMGAVLSEDSIRTSLQTNLAAVRLDLLERCTTGATYELNHSLRLVVRGQVADEVIEADGAVEETRDPVQEAVVVNLPFSLNEMTLGEACSNALNAELKDFRPAEQVFLVRQAHIDLTSLDTNQDEIMNILIEISNGKSSGSPASGADAKPKRSRARRNAPERGFTDTLLSGGTPKPQARAGDNDAQKQASFSTDETSKPDTNNSKHENHRGDVSPAAKRQKADAVAGERDEDNTEVLQHSDAEKEATAASSRQDREPERDRDALVAGLVERLHNEYQFEAGHEDHFVRAAQLTLDDHPLENELENLETPTVMKLLELIGTEIDL